jgi:hypothetical protein
MFCVLAMLYGCTAYRLAANSASAPAGLHPFGGVTSKRLPVLARAFVRGCRHIQSEYLVERGLVGDEPKAHKIGACLSKPRMRHRQTLGDRGLRVVAQSLGIGHRDQKQIQRARRGITALGVPITHQALIEPTELRRNLAYPLAHQHPFGRHDWPAPARCLAPVVAAAGRPWRCPLATHCR